MKTIVRSSVMLAITLAVALLPAAGQTAGDGNTAKLAATQRFDLALTYTYKSAKISTTSTRFGLQGGSFDGVYWLGPKQKNLGVAFDFSGEAASNIEPGVSLHQMSLVVGPRYTLWQSKSKRLRPNVYGEGLIGFVHAYNTVFPTIPTTSSTNALAFQAGGGLNLPFKQPLGLRIAEVDYIATRLPNNNDSYQGDIRVSTGLTLHF